jgi:predicted RecA/RadA family phage recombinase
MKNFIQEGRYLTLAAPYEVVAGDGAQVGQLFGVAALDALSGADTQFDTQGVYELDKAPSQAWAVGAAVYWDNTNKYCTTTASGNLLIGAAMAVVGSGAEETLGKVRLNGIARPDEA